MRTINLVAALVLATASQQALAAWTLDNSKSQLNFVSTKVQHVSEMHHFTQLSGTMASDGKFSVDVDLTSVETNIEIRNERMKEHLFHVDAMPKATLSGTVPATILKMPAGSSQVGAMDAMLALNGVQQSIQLELQVTKTQDNGFVATTTKPILINASQFNLTSGIDKLKELAGLNSIGLMVPVTFSVTFVADSL